MESSDARTTNSNKKDKTIELFLGIALLNFLSLVLLGCTANYQFSKVNVRLQDLENNSHHTFSWLQDLERKVYHLGLERKGQTKLKTQETRPNNGNHFKEKDNLEASFELLSRVPKPSPRKSSLLEDSRTQIEHPTISVNHFQYESEVSKIKGRFFPDSHRQLQTTGSHIYHSRCQGNDFKLKIRLEYVDDITWELINMKTNASAPYQLKSKNELQSIQVYSFCIDDGFFLFSLKYLTQIGLQCNTQQYANVDQFCYQISVNDDILTGSYEISPSHFQYEFYVLDGISGNYDADNKCALKPALLPTHQFNGFIRDERVAEMLQVFYMISSQKSLDNFESAQYQAACFLLFDDKAEMNARNEYLMEKYIHTILRFETKQHVERAFSWNYCDMVSVICDEDNNTIALNISQKNLSGTIPSELSNLRYLESIDFSYNQFVGDIPTELGLLFRLEELYVNSNRLTGTIPSEMGHLLRLEILKLGKNSFSGQIPSEIGFCKSMTHLNFWNNFLDGSIPHDLFDATKLVTLVLSYNDLTGTLPTTVGQLRKLRQVKLNNNKLNGTIPNEIWLPSLTHVDLSSNDLTGTLSKEIGNSEILEDLFVNRNRLNGTLPDSFDRLNNLTVILANNNSFIGTFPNSLWRLNSLDTLWLHQNDFHGSIPKNACANIFDIHVDDSTWFMEKPKVSCHCCHDKTSVFVWSPKFDPHIPCPEANVMNVDSGPDGYDYVKDFHVIDEINLFWKPSLCQSPTGCYKTSVSKHNFKFFGYSNETNSVVESNAADQRCDAVQICGMTISPTDPRRKIINHITQLTVASVEVKHFLNDDGTFHYKALCWMLESDQPREFFNDQNYANGSVLLRYVMAIFVNSTGYFERMKHQYNFASNPTCVWPNIICDQNNVTIEQIKFRNEQLKGTLITEIGFLASLKVLDLSGNNLAGKIDSSLFSYMGTNLEVFNISNNDFDHGVIEEFLVLPKLKVIDVSNNRFGGTLPFEVPYSPNMEFFDVSNNHLNGEIPYALTKLPKLKVMDLSQNNFDGEIFSEWGELEDLHTIKLNQNKFSGCIPTQMFSLSKISVLMLHSNELTGTISALIENFRELQTLSLHHNQFKGTIPRELGDLMNLRLVLLHDNELTGTAPTIKKEGISYISDCGFPNYNLPGDLVCDSCTKCCNSDEECQDVTVSKVLPISIRHFVLILAFAFAVGYTLIVLLIIQFTGDSYILLASGLKVDIVDIHLKDSAYMFILSSNRIANVLYMLTTIMQTLLFYVYLYASEFDDKYSDWQYSYICPDDSIECESLNYVNGFGWTMFGIVLIAFLGHDLVKSAQQILNAVALKDYALGLKGFVLMFLTSLAALTSIFYNIAFSVKNTDLIMNAAILLFINEMDENVFNICNEAMPHWVRALSEEMNENLIRITTNTPLKLSLREKYEAIDGEMDEDRQRLLH